MTPGHRRNFSLGVTNGILFTFAETLIDPSLVLVAFVSQLTASPILIGLVTPLRDGAWYLPQLWVSGWLQSQPYKLRLYRFVGVVRVVLWTGMTLAAFSLREAGGLLTAFFLTFGAYSLFSGLSGLPFLEVMGKTIPPKRRATFFAWRLFLGGLVALGASALVRWLLDSHGPLGFPHNFALLFGLGLVPAAVGLYVYQLIDEPPDTHLLPAVSPRVQLRRAWSIVRQDRNYRRLVALRVSLLMAGAALPFLAVYVKQELGGPPEVIGLYLAVYTLATLVTNVFFLWFARRIGNRWIMVLASVSGLLMTLIAAALILAARLWGVSGWAASLWLAPVFALNGFRESAAGVAGQPLLMDIAPPADRTLYLGFTNTLSGIILLSTSVSGVVVATFGLPVLVALTALAYGLALVAALRVREAAPAETNRSVNEPQSAV